MGKVVAAAGTRRVFSAGVKVGTVGKVVPAGTAGKYLGISAKVVGGIWPSWSIW